MKITILTENLPTYTYPSNHSSPVSNWITPSIDYYFISPDVGMPTLTLLWVIQWPDMFRATYFNHILFFRYVAIHIQSSNLSNWQHHDSKSDEWTSSACCQWAWECGDDLQVDRSRHFDSRQTDHLWNNDWISCSWGGKGRSLRSWKQICRRRQGLSFHIWDRSWWWYSWSWWVHTSSWWTNHAIQDECGRDGGATSNYDRIPLPA